MEKIDLSNSAAGEKLSSGEGTQPKKEFNGFNKDGLESLEMSQLKEELSEIFKKYKYLEVL